MSLYLLVLIVNIPIWCHTALESTFNAISTVDTAEMSLCLDFHMYVIPTQYIPIIQTGLY